MSQTPRTKQKACGKRRFKDHKQAIRGLHRIRNRSTRNTIPVRTYQCPTCNGWHLTSQD